MSGNVSFIFLVCTQLKNLLHDIFFNLKVQGGEDTPGWVGVGVGGGTALLSEQMLVSLEVIPGKRLSSRVVYLCFFLKPD